MPNRQQIRAMKRAKDKELREAAQSLPRSKPLPKRVEALEKAMDQVYAALSDLNSRVPQRERRTESGLIVPP